jgi:hypothetical protein
MISKTLTGITFNEYNPTVDLPFYVNDTFFSSSPVSFCSTLSFLNNILGLSINAGNISNYKLYIRITSSLNTPLNILFEDTIQLSASNVVNSSIVVSVFETVNKISHDYLCYNTNTTEKNNLYKSFKIIFRIFDSAGEATHLANKTNILANDIEQELNISFNPTESGPYDVGFKTIDVVHPDEFTPQEIINIFTKNIIMVGGESVRVFYPKNKISSPLVVFVHGVSHEQEDYDAYMQRLASYGYFCLSFNINLQNLNHITNLTGATIESPIQSGANFNWGPIYILRLIDHIKSNTLKISGGFFHNNIDFSKINLIGHSRGGAIVHSANLLLDRKTSPYGNISDISIISNDIKSLIKIGPADGGSVFNDGTFLRTNDVTRFNFIQEDIISNFSRYVKTPILTVRTQNDGDVTLQFNIDDLQSGISFEYKRNIPERLIFVNQHLGHSELRDPYGDSEPPPDYQTKANYDPIVYGRNEKYLNYNSTDVDLASFVSEFILFLSINNYNSNKLKKLRFAKQNIKNKKIYTEKFPNHPIYYFKYDDIKLVLDSYDGITMSYAGSNGLTFSSIGYTYDYGNDADYYREFTSINFNPGSTYMNAIKNNIVSGLPTNYYLNFNRIPRFNVNDTYNGIVYTLGKSLFLPIENNFFMGYTLSSPIAVEENEYFCLTGTLKHFLSFSGNTLDSNFNLTLFDNSLNTATLSSRMSGNGFSKMEIPYTNSSYLSLNDSAGMGFPGVMCAMTSNIFFRAGDFVFKNPSLNLNNINQMLLSFGPDYGSTFCHVSLDDFIIIKKL